MQITGGYLKSRKIISPKSENVRPTLSKTRESVFNILMNIINFEDSSFLDVFAGSGIMGIEAASRGFNDVFFVEKDKKTYFLLKENLKNLGLNLKIYYGDSNRVLKTLDKKFDVIYADPPYKANLYNSIITVIKEKEILNTGGILILEHPEDELINTDGFKLIKQKKYADKIITYLNRA